MRTLVILCGCLLTGFCLKAQLIQPGNLDSLNEREAVLQPLADQMVNAADDGERTVACNALVPELIGALKIRNSFFYPFDSLHQISILYPRDSSFRIFTWQLSRTTGDYVYFGAIQMKTADGQLKLFPLLDYSEITSHFGDTITNNHRWMGALYYNLVETTYGSKKYYTLFGINGNNVVTNRKILEVLTFPRGEPVFGDPVFSFSEGKQAPVLSNRFVLEYKVDANARLNYDPDLHMIVYDHLVSLTSEPLKKFTLVPGGSDEAFRWENGVWKHISEAFSGPAKKLSVPKPLNMTHNLGKENQ